MDILVCIKQVPATNEVEIDQATGALKRDGAAAKVNPYDLYALEMAFSLRERYGGKVDVLTMGPLQAKAALLEALHMGADNAVLLSDRSFAGADVVATSLTLAAGVRKMGRYDLILCGKQTTDGDTAQVGPEMAEHLNLEHACYVLDAYQAEEGLVVRMNLGHAVQTQVMPLPCLLTIEKDVNTPRLPSYKRSLQVGREQIKEYGLKDFEENDARIYGLSGSPTQVEQIFPPEKSGARRLRRGGAEALAQAAFELLKTEKFI